MGKLIMLISEMEAQLKELREKYGELEIVVDGLSGVYEKIIDLKTAFIMGIMRKLDNGETILTGKDYIVLKTKG